MTVSDLITVICSLVTFASACFIFWMQRKTAEATDRLREVAREARVSSEAALEQLQLTAFDRGLLSDSKRKIERQLGETLDQKAEEPAVKSKTMWERLEDEP